MTATLTVMVMPRVILVKAVVVPRQEDADHSEHVHLRPVRLLVGVRDYVLRAKPTVQMVV